LSTAASPPPPLRAAAAVLATVAALALAGGGLALGAIAAGRDRQADTVVAAAAKRPAGTASFGPIVVQRVAAGPLTPEAHLVHEGTEPARELRVRLTATNRGTRAVPFSPGQFRVRVGRRRSTIAPIRPNPPPDAIAAGQTLRQALAFVVPDRRDSYTIVFDDLARPAPLLIALGTVAGPRPRKAATG
jgi:hypothetical protein